jgi:hypothetical protein
VYTDDPDDLMSTSAYHDGEQETDDSMTICVSVLHHRLETIAHPTTERDDARDSAS